MEHAPAATGSLWPLAAYGIAVVAIVAAMVALSYILGQRHRERATGHKL